MDGTRFDVMTRAIAATRRGVFRTLFGGVLGSLLAIRASEEAGAGCKKVGKKCDKNKDCFDESCIAGARKGGLA